MLNPLVQHSYMTKQETDLSFLEINSINATSIAVTGIILKIMGIFEGFIYP